MKYVLCLQQCVMATMLCYNGQVQVYNTSEETKLVEVFQLKLGIYMSIPAHNSSINVVYE